MTAEKECFFISPIGDEGSDERIQADKVMEYIVEEALGDFEYHVTRADMMDHPGSITEQVIQKTIESELVIADLTGHNPNVFYELAVRHATGDPCIQIIDQTESIPFDINDFRTIKYGLDVQQAEQARNDIAAQVNQIEQGEQEFGNPISKSAELHSLRTSDNPEDQKLADILEKLSGLDRKMDQLENRKRHRSDDHNPLIGNSTQNIELDGKKFRLPDPATLEKLYQIAEHTNYDREKIIQVAKDRNINIHTDNKTESLADF